MLSLGQYQEDAVMSEKPLPAEPTLVTCDVCLAEIPESVAVSQEADEYTLHFCGLDCYSKWKAQRSPEKGAAGNNET